MGRKSKSCPVGLICINTTYLLILLIITIFILFYFILKPQNNIQHPAPPKIDKIQVHTPSISIVEKPNKKNNENNRNINKNNRNINENNRSINENKQEIYLINEDYERIINPLIPPERRNFHIDKSSLGVAINVPTRGYTGGAMQVGALYKQDTSNEDQKVGQNNEPVILPLFGGPTHNGSSKWYYYTSTDKYNQIKLPLSNKNRSCNVEYGCDELYDGDMVTVPAYNGEFKVVKYEYDKPRYLPHF